MSGEWLRKSLCAAACAEASGYCWSPGHPKYDGCLVKFDMLPGVSFQHPDTVSRKTLVHEAGHWLNLGHTHDEDAEDKVCSNTDDVADTVQNPYVGRFAQNQLPCKDGVLTAVPQPVYNWMSYAPIRNRFTTVCSVASGCATQHSSSLMTRANAHRLMLVSTFGEGVSGARSAATRWK